MKILRTLVLGFLFCCLWTGGAFAQEQTGSGTGGTGQGTTGGGGSAGGGVTSVTGTAPISCTGSTAVTCSAPTLIPGTYWQPTGYSTGGTTINTTDSLTCGGFIVPPGGLSVGHVSFFVSVQDLSNVADVGIYSGASGATATLEAHIGAQIISSYSPTLAFSGGTQTLAPGRSLFCITSSSATFALTSGQDYLSFYLFQNVPGSTSTGGALPSSFTSPADTPYQGDGAIFILTP